MLHPTTLCQSFLTENINYSYSGNSATSIHLVIQDDKCACLPSQPKALVEHSFKLQYVWYSTIELALTMSLCEAFHHPPCTPPT